MSAARARRRASTADGDLRIKVNADAGPTSRHLGHESHPKSKGPTMADTAPKMLLRSEHTGGHIAIVELRAQAARRFTAMTSTRPAACWKACGHRRPTTRRRPA